MRGWRRLADRFYWWAQGLVAPGLLNSQYLYAEALRGRVAGCGRWLDLGCGHALLPDWLSGSVRPPDIGSKFFVGLDFDRSSLLRHRVIKLRVQGAAASLPFRDGSFDLVSANMVVEHLDQPGRAFSEIHRVLRPGGRWLFHTPNRWGHTTILPRLIPSALLPFLARLLLQRRAEDVYPTYYLANTERSIQAFAREAGLEVAEIRYVHSSAQFMAIPPLAFLELIWIRLLSRSALAGLRACLIVTLERPK